MCETCFWCVYLALALLALIDFGGCILGSRHWGMLVRSAMGHIGTWVRGLTWILL